MCTENLNPDVVVMKSAKAGLGQLMSWLFEGTGTQIGFSLTEDGDLYAHGSGVQMVQEPYASFLQHLAGIEGAWSLRPLRAKELEPSEVTGVLK